jgi:hypothetical protein
MTGNREVSKNAIARHAVPEMGYNTMGGRQKHATLTSSISQLFGANRLLTDHSLRQCRHQSHENVQIREEVGSLDNGSHINWRASVTGFFSA